VIAGAPVIEQGMVESDFADLAAAGVALLSSLGDTPAEVVFCCATGNTARVRSLDCGMIELGRPADFVLMDRAQHSDGADLLDSVRKGDLPGLGMVIVDGIVRCGRSRNTPPAERVPAVAG
jgi:enamidase